MTNDPIPTRGQRGLVLTDSGRKKLISALQKRFTRLSENELIKKICLEAQRDEPPRDCRPIQNALTGKRTVGWDTLMYILDKIQDLTNDRHITILHEDYEKKSKVSSPQNASQEDLFRTAYHKMTYWHDFPVGAFRGRTTLKHAIFSQVISQTEIETEETVTKPPLAMVGLADFRSNGVGAKVLQTVQETVERQHAEQKLPHLLIFGEAGDGKSTLLRKLGKHYCDRGLFPVLIKAREWEDSQKPLSEFLRLNYFAQEEDSILREGGAQLWNKVCAAQAPLLIDGLDEMQYPDKIEEKLTRITAQVEEQQRSNLIILVTCRRQGYRNALREFKRVEMQPFDFDQQVKPYLRARLGEDAPALIERLQSDARTQALVGNGLMFAMLCYWWEEFRRSTQSHQFDLPISRVQLYDWAVSQLLDDPKELGRTSHREFHSAPDLKRAILAAVAFHSQFCHNHCTDISSSLVHKALEEVTLSEPYSREWSRREAVLDEIVFNSELLTCNSIKTLYRFFHPTFQEYFAAQYLASHWEAEHWCDWLPTRKEWQFYGSASLVADFFNEGVFENLDSEFACPVCRKVLRPFSNLILQPAYQETILLMVGMLNSPQREAIILNGITKIPPPLPGYRSETYDSGLVFVAGFDDVDMYDSSVLLQEIKTLYLPNRTLNALEIAALKADFQEWLLFGLSVISRCTGEHPEVVSRVLCGIVASSSHRRTEFENGIQILGKARNPANVSVAVELFKFWMSDRSCLDLWLSAGSSLLQTQTGWAACLTLLGNKDAEEYLLSMIEHDTYDLPLRNSLASILWKRGRKTLHPRLVPHLLQLLSDAQSTDEDRETARDALCKIGTQEAISGLLLALKDGCHTDEFRGSIALKLAELPGKLVVHTLTEFINETSYPLIIRRSSAYSLAGIAFLQETITDSQVIPNDLISILEDRLLDKDEDEAVRGWMASALGDIPHPGKALIATLQNPSNSLDLRIAAARSLGSIGTEDIGDVLNALTSITSQNADARLVKMADLARERIRHVPKAVPATKTLLKAPNVQDIVEPQLRDFILFTLLQRKNVLFANIVSDSTTSDQRIAATQVFANEFGGQPFERQQLDELDAIAKLLHEIEDDRNPTILRQEIVRLLNKIDRSETSSTLPRLVKATMKHENPLDLRITIAWELGERRSLIPVQDFLQLINDPLTHPRLRCTVIRALGKIDGISVRPLLEQLVITLNTNEDETVRKAYIETLLEIRDNEKARWY